MEVLNSSAALLSNYEVLSLLRELESDHIARTKTALRVKKEEEAATASGMPAPSSISTHNLEASENLRTVEVEAIKYLSADFLPTSSQTNEGITKLVKSLSPWNLTKAEKLQIVNLSPTLPVELYVIIEELEDRFGDHIDEILENVKSSLTLAATETSHTNGSKELYELPSVGVDIIGETDQWDEDADGDADETYDEELFDDTGAGIGVEGDLEMNED